MELNSKKSLIFSRYQGIDLHHRQQYFILSQFLNVEGPGFDFFQKPLSSHINEWPSVYLSSMKFFDRENDTNDAYRHTSGLYLT